MNPAVLLIDMQKGFIDCESPAGKLIIPSQLEVLSYCAKADVPVVVVEYAGGGQTIDVLLRKCESIKRKEFWEKNIPGAFDNEGYFASVLDKFNAHYLVLMGVNSACCVKETAHGALEHGFKIGTARDIIANLRYGKREIAYVNEKSALFLLEKIFYWFKLKNPLENKLVTISPEDLSSQSVIDFYKEKGDFFNNHKDLIAHLEAKR